MFIRPMLTILILFCLTSPALGEEPLLLVTSDYPPYTYTDHGTPGFLAEAVLAACKVAGIPVKVEFYPWRRCEMMVREGLAFAAFPYAKTANRSSCALFSDTIVSGRSVFFFLKGRDIPTDYKSLLDLGDYTIGGISGYHYEPFFRDLALTVEYTSNEVSTFHKLLAKRVDYVAMNEITGWHILNENFPNQTHLIDVTPSTWREATMHLMVSRVFPNASDLLARFNKGYAQIKNNGTYRKLLIKYGLGKTR